YSHPEDAGEVSHFQALATALSGTVGLGNIAGVAVAVSIGGPGATFWMILAGLLGMASKFTECTLGVKYRNEYEDGRVSGGPMYYLSKGLTEKGKPGLGKVLAVIFSICCIGGAVGGGNMFQANQAFQQVVNVTGGENSFLAGSGWLFGLIMAIVVGVVIIGGIKSIAKVTEKIVPLMAIIYVTAGLVIILSNISMVGDAFAQIFVGAFTGAGVAGGVIGALIQGFKRAAFSNEAGIGSAAIAHSAVRTKEPVTEGYVALLEPFIDTVVICTMTALVITISGELNSGLTGVELTSAAFASAFTWFPLILALAVVLFAFSTMLSWSYYGLKSWTYLVGEGKGKEIIFKLFFCLCVIVGASMSLGPVIDFSDSMIFAMAIPNIIGLYFLMPVVRGEVRQYWAKIESGEIKKVK
ncbi:alanine/glycine:cation symporter family protein, partial [Thalassospira sp. UBA848]